VARHASTSLLSEVLSYEFFDAFLGSVFVFVFIIGLELSSKLFSLLRWAISQVCHCGVSFLGFLIKAYMERRFFVEAKAFYFLV